jgi:hypothetical protein
MQTNERTERTPREEAIVQIVQFAGLMLICIVAPLVERAMSDPDIAYRVNWHLRHFKHLVEKRLYEAGMVIETAVGLYQLEQHLRREWHGNKTGVGRGDPEGTGGGPVL